MSPFILVHRYIDLWGFTTTAKSNSIYDESMNDENEHKKKELAKLVEYLLELEEIHYLRRSRATWLKNGDRNTVFFQAFASARRRKN